MSLWLFENVTRAYSFAPAIRSLSIANSQPCQLATLSCVLEDKNRNIVMANEDEVRVKFNGVVVFAGDLTQCDLTDRGPQSGPRVYELAAVDYTARLDDNLIRGRDRPAETVTNRVLWIMSYGTRGITMGGVESSGRMVDAHPHFRGKTLNEGLKETMREVGQAAWVKYDKVLQYRIRFNMELPNAPFALRRPRTTYTTDPPYTGFWLGQGSKDLKTAVRVQGDGIKRWRVSPSKVTLYGRQEANIDASFARSRRALRRIGDRYLRMADHPAREGRLYVTQPGLEPMQVVHVINPMWGIDEPFLITSTQITYISRTKMQMEVRFSDRFIPCELKPGYFGKTVASLPAGQRSIASASVPVAASSVGLEGSALPQGNGTHDLGCHVYTMPEGGDVLDIDQPDSLGGQWAIWHGYIPANDAAFSINVNGTLTALGGSGLESKCLYLRALIRPLGSPYTPADDVELAALGCIFTPWTWTVNATYANFGLGTPRTYDRHVVVYASFHGGTGNVTGCSFSGSVTADGFAAGGSTVDAYAGEVFGPALGVPV